MLCFGKAVCFRFSADLRVSESLFHPPPPQMPFVVETSVIPPVLRFAIFIFIVSHTTAQRPAKRERERRKRKPCAGGGLAPAAKREVSAQERVCFWCCRGEASPLYSISTSCTAAHIYISSSPLTSLIAGLSFLLLCWCAGPFERAKKPRRLKLRPAVYTAARR